MLLHLAPLQAHWGSCKKFWEPEGTKAFIYLYEGEYIAGSKLVQMMWKRKKEKKKRLRRRFLVDCGITCEKKEYTALPFHVRHELNIHTANQNISDSMTVCKVTMWNEWGVPHRHPSDNYRRCILKQGTSFLITLVELLICQQQTMRWAGRSKRLPWQPLSV